MPALNIFDTIPEQHFLTSMYRKVSCSSVDGTLTMLGASESHILTTELFEWGKENILPIKFSFLNYYNKKLKFLKHGVLLQD